MPRRPDSAPRPFGIPRPDSAPPPDRLDLTRRPTPPTPTAALLARFGLDADSGLWHQLDGDDWPYCQRRIVLAEEADSLPAGCRRCGECEAEERTG